MTDEAQTPVLDATGNPAVVPPVPTAPQNDGVPTAEVPAEPATSNAAVVEPVVAPVEVPAAAEQVAADVTAALTASPKAAKTPTTVKRTLAQKVTAVMQEAEAEVAHLVQEAETEISSAFHKYFNSPQVESFGPEVHPARPLPPLQAQRLEQAGAELAPKA